MKMSFQYHYQTGNRRKVRFMSLSDGYHGETLGALSVGGLDLYSELYKPLLLDIVRIPAPDCYRCPKGKNGNAARRNALMRRGKYSPATVRNAPPCWWNPCSRDRPA